MPRSPSRMAAVSPYDGTDTTSLCSSLGARLGSRTTSR